MGVLDTGCASTVCGIKWHQQYLDQISPQDPLKVTKNNSLKQVTFGDGDTIESVKYAVKPAMFGDQAVFVAVEIVPVEIPLLIGKSSTAKAKTIINVHENKATVFRRDVSFLLSSTGHLLISLRPDLIDSFAFVSKTQENEESAKNFYRFPVHFGRCTATRLVSLLK